ncbi:hypothetical protein VSR01_29415 [Actinacidiphila sp. DG2A-62]|jgi:hypothetical protein|uniref:hypothetical protein n=1 Tax=Actinacidiphila sp. DG2A-62 TaxID=3108821 RepID=UPI002DBF3E70|nr:hypothetical protein [Actinacidiphila sp. DG2A-62]MEC3997402.1 hypothetical protein [Actinacidiphila sp. DG2A-62]
MKTTLMFRQMIANPRRTTLAHLTDATDADAPRPAAVPVRDADAAPLPQRTANPRRTVLTELPKAPTAG